MHEGFVRACESCLSTFHFTRTEVVVAGLTARMTGGSSGTETNREEERGHVTHRETRFSKVI